VSGAAVVAGTASWILAEAACLVVLWAALGWSAAARQGRDDPDAAPPRPPVVSVPLATGIVVALAVSLVVAT
jgi:hypothetical protein